MGYYSPTFANLDSKWYWTTTDPNYSIERDACSERWNHNCDEILAKALKEYGMFISAFEIDIQMQISAVENDVFPFPRYFSYFYMSKILSNLALRNQLFTEYTTNANKILTCSNCNTIQVWDQIHPTIIKRTKKVIELCNDCCFWLSEMTSLENLTTIPCDFYVWYKKMHTKQICPVCKKKHIWIKNNDKHKLDEIGIPSRYVEICRTCAMSAHVNHTPDITITESVSRFKKVADILGCIPNRDGFFFNQASKLEDAVTVIKELKNLHSVQEMVSYCGSWFKLLVVSGILPNGTRKTHFGTMVLANDGCQCLSLAEKDIDDKLFAHGIKHFKEPFYPNSNYRADWKICVNGKDVYVEFFGLYGEKNYNKRMKEKIEYANSIGVTIISFYQKDLNSLDLAFKEKILSLFTNN